MDFRDISEKKGMKWGWNAFITAPPARTLSASEIFHQRCSVERDPMLVNDNKIILTGMFTHSSTLSRSLYSLCMSSGYGLVKLYTHTTSSSIRPESTEKSSISVE